MVYSEVLPTHHPGTDIALDLFCYHTVPPPFSSSDFIGDRNLSFQPIALGLSVKTLQLLTRGFRNAQTRSISTSATCCETHKASSRKACRGTSLADTVFLA